MTSGARRLLHLLEIATVGLPFCAFKFLTGGVLLGMGAWRPLGWVMLALGAVDLVLNLANFSLANVAPKSLYRLPYTLKTLALIASLIRRPLLLPLFRWITPLLPISFTLRTIRLTCL